MIENAVNRSFGPLQVELTSVSKWYGPVIAVNDISIEVQPGITGLVGHNGAGKSTLIKLLTGQLRPSLGKVRIYGKDAWTAAAKSYIGYCPDTDAFYEEMSGRTFVRTMAKFHGLRGHSANERIEQLLEQVGMSERADRPLASYSKGMRQRIKLAQALVHDPDLVVLDEPLNGVDPVGRNELIRVFRRLADEGKSILISTHILDEMDTLASNVLFVCRGRLLAAGTLAEIRDMLDDHPLKIRLSAADARNLAGQLLKLETVLAVELTSSDDLLLRVRHPKVFYAQLADLVVAESFDVRRMQVIDGSTEAIFEYLLHGSAHI